MNIIWGLSKNSWYMPLWYIYDNVNYFWFNLIIRIFWPTVYIIFLSILFYLYSLISVKWIWLIIPLYYSINLFIIIFLGRYRFIEWRFMIFYYFIWTIVWYFVYKNFILEWIDYLLPDITSMRSDLWLIIVLFLIWIIHRQETDYSSQDKMRRNYIRDKYIKYQNLFSKELSWLDPKFKNIILSIMIYEDSNRPAQIRLVENFYYFLLKLGFRKRALSTWIMQVKSTKLLTDSESIKEAIKILKPTFSRNKNKSDLVQILWEKYNWYNYSYEIEIIYDVIDSLKK